jgi:lipid-binding SYLF domain-containing protein
MWTRRLLLAASAMLATLVCAVSGAQEVDPKVAQERQEADTRADEIIAEFLASVDGAQALYDKAAGYAVFRVTKAGFGVSGAGGTGVAVNTATSHRTYMKMGSGGVGWTFGASRYDIVILFETAERLEGFMAGGWDSAATAQAAAGSAKSGVSSTFFDGVAYFQISDKGLMASADVSGTRFWVAEDLN